MAKITLSDPQNLQNESTVVTTLAANNRLIETAMEKTLSRDGTIPNQMQAEFDMNNYSIINLPAPNTLTEPVRLQEFNDLVSGTVVLPIASNSNPIMNGVEAPGVSSSYSRADHVHPTDTTRAALASPTFTGTPAAPTASALTNTTQIATTAFVTATTREKLTANRNYYVRTDGSDSNTGLANTSGAAFLTLQKAMDVISALDCSIYDVTVNIADGTYTGTGYRLLLKTYLGSGTIYFIGNTTTPANVVIISTNSTAVSSLVDGGRFNFNGMRLAGNGAQDIAVSGVCDVTLQNMEYNGSSANYRVYCYNKARLILSGNYHKFTNSTAGQIGAFLCEQLGQIYLNSSTLTWTVSVTYSGANVTCRAIAYLEAASCTCSIGAFTVTGTRYLVSNNAVVNGAGSTTLFPGTSAGTTSTGGQYS